MTRARGAGSRCLLVMRVRFIQDSAGLADRIGHAVASRAEVDEVIARAKAAGAAVTDSPHDRPWGIYSGYFQDPDGHLWEIICNPALDLAPS
ncbi:MAG TPA: VOC family protein [Trebonia sp.]